MLSAVDHRSAYALTALQAVAENLTGLEMPAGRRAKLCGLLDVAAEAVAGGPLARTERARTITMSANLTEKESVPVPLVGTVVSFGEFERRRRDREAAGRRRTDRPD